MSTIIFWVLGAVVLVFGGYSNYTNWKTYFASKREKEIFMKNHHDAKVAIVGKNRIWLCWAGAALCLGLASFMAMATQTDMDAAQRYSMSLVYFSLCVYLVAMAIEATTVSRICYTPEGFMYADTYRRYKQINGVEVGGWVFKSSFIHFGNKEQVAVPKSLAVWVQESWVDWKKAKDAKRKKGRRRG